MANIILQYGGTTYRTLGYTGRVTNPSLILSGGGQTLYTPLFAVASGAEGRVGNYYYRCCPLVVQNGGTTYRAAYARRYADSFSRTISTTISHSGKTSSTTTTVNKSVTKGPWYITTDNFGFNYMERYVTVNFGVTFSSPPSVSYNTSWFRVDTVTTTSCRLYPSDGALNVYLTSVANGNGAAAIAMLAQISTNVTASGQISQTVTTYPSETKSSTASGDFSYGVTYPSAPSLWSDNGVSVYNNGGNASFHASKTLTGTVAYGQSATLSQAFNVSFSGNA